MAPRRTQLALVLVSAGLAACGSARTPPASPPPTVSRVDRPIDALQIYSGLWYAYGRVNGRRPGECAPEALEFRRALDGDLFERDFCRTARGARRQSEGRLAIENPGLDTKYVVRQRVMSGFYVPKSFVILDHGARYQWFIRSAPSEEELVVYTRAAAPQPDLVKRLSGALQALGVDPDRLEELKPEDDIERLKAEALKP